jgi:NitT/TauT family transport system substrate-binding protein
MKKKKRTGGFVALIAGLALFMLPFSLSGATAADKVDLRLHWKVGSEHVPFIVAMDKGFYKKEGIDITVREGAGSTATLKLIGAGKETFGLCGTNVVVKGVVQGVPVMQIMLNEANKTQGILLHPDSGIKTPQDLKGKIIAGSGSGVSDIWEAFLAANNLTMKDVKYLAAGRARLEAVAAGKAQGSLGNSMNDILTLEEMGLKSPGFLLLSDWGVPLIGDGVIAHVDTVKNKPDLVRRFVKASIYGINHTCMDIEAAADIAVKHFPMTNKKRLVNQLLSLRWLFLPPLGYQNPKFIEEIRNLILK